MNPLPRHCLCLLFTLAVFPAWSQSGVVEERITNENGFIETCGEGAGLSPCRDVNGETYDEEVRGPSPQARVALRAFLYDRRRSLMVEVVEVTRDAPAGDPARLAAACAEALQAAIEQLAAAVVRELKAQGK